MYFKKKVKQRENINDFKTRRLLTSPMGPHMILGLFSKQLDDYKTCGSTSKINNLGAPLSTLCA